MMKENLAIEHKGEETLNIWNSAFEAIETLFNGDDISLNLEKVLMIVRDFMCGEDAFIYKFDKNINKFICYKHLGKYSTYTDMNYGRGRITNINVNTNDNSYLIIIDNDNIVNEEIYSEYLKVLKRLFKLVFMRIEFHEKLIIASTTDSLTHTYNRTYYNMIANDIFKNGEAIVTYSLIDLFRLKYVNDNYGHKYGDMYIVIVSELISKEIDKEDMLFRIGGDEFVILSRNMKKDDMINKLDNINNLLREETLGLKIPFPLNINYGVVEGNTDLDTFYSKSDELLSHHKSLTYKKLNIDRRR